MTWDIGNRRFTIGSIDLAQDITPGVNQTSFSDFSAMPNSAFTRIVVTQGALWSYMLVQKVGAILRPVTYHDGSNGVGNVVSFSAGVVSVFSDLGWQHLVYINDANVAQNADAVIRSFSPETLTELKTVSPIPLSGKSVAFLRNIIAGDKKSAFYVWEPAEATAGDDFNYVVSALSATGRWVRQRQILELPQLSADGDAQASTIYRLSTGLRSKDGGNVARTIAEVENVARQGTYATLALLKATASARWRQGDLIELRGIDAEGDIEPIVGTWQASSTNTDSLDRTFVRLDDTSGVNPGRFQFPQSIRRNIPNVATATELTIASGAVTPTQASHTIDTEADAASDDLVTLVATHAKAGDVITLSAASDARTVVIKATGGNIVTPSGSSVTLDDSKKTAFLRYDGANWNVFEAGGNDYATIAALKAVSPQAGGVVGVQGHSAIGDGGHNNFLVLSGNAAANGYANTLDGVVFQNTAGDRTFVATDPINRLLFERIGIFPGATAAANGAAWALAIAFVDAVNQGANFVVGEGTYGFDRALSVTDIVGVRFVGQGKDRSILNFTGATNTNGIEFVGASWFGDVEKLQVNGADYSGVLVDAGGANPAANNFHIAIRDCELTLNGRHGLQIDEGFMMALDNVLSQSNGWDGFHVEGFTTTLTAHTCWALDNGRNGGAAAPVNALAGHHGNGWTINDIQYATFIACGSDNNGNDVSGTGFGWHVSNCATLTFLNCGAEANRDTGMALRANSTIAAAASFSLFSVRNIRIIGFEGVNNNTAQATRTAYAAGAGAGQFPFGATGAGLIELRSAGTTAHFVKAIIEQGELITPGSSPAILVDGAETDVTYVGPALNGGFSILNSGKLHHHDAYDDLFQWRVNDKPLFTTGRIGGINVTLLEADATYQEIRGDVYSGGAAFHGTYDTRRRARGTKAAAAAVASGDTIAAQDLFGHDGTNFVRCGQIGFSVQGTVSTGVVPGSYAISLANAAGVLTQRLGILADGTATLSGPAVLAGGLRMPIVSNLVISAGKIAAPAGGGLITIDTEAAAASDDLDGITGGTIGDILIIQALNGARTVVAIHNSGSATGTEKMWLGASKTLDNTPDTLVLRRNADGWCQVAFNDNAA